MSNMGDAARSSFPDTEHREFGWRWAWIAVVTGCLAGVLVIVILWGSTTADHHAAFDAGWRVAAAVLAVFASLLGVSRLQISQRELWRQVAADQAARDENVAREISDLSTKASEQLGSANAATRMGGLFALERLAQSYPDMRQGVVDQLCAYLRRPYTPPAIRRRRNYWSPLSVATDSHEVTSSASASKLPEVEIERRLELDVRGAAQGILGRHLTWTRGDSETPATFWPGVSLNLRSAILVDFIFAHCRVRSADFGDAELHGDTHFGGASFDSAAHFDDATFLGDADFTSAHFLGNVAFVGATFQGSACFSSTQFSGVAFFDRTRFVEHAYFDHAATFDGAVMFREVEFKGRASFDHAVFARYANFQGTTFAGIADFGDATFVMKDDRGLVASLPNSDETVSVSEYYLFMLDNVKSKPNSLYALPPGWEHEGDAAKSGDAPAQLRLNPRFVIDPEVLTLLASERKIIASSSMDNLGCCPYHMQS